MQHSLTLKLSSAQDNKKLALTVRGAHRRQYVASIEQATTKPYLQVADSDACDVDFGGWGNRYYGKR